MVGRAVEAMVSEIELVNIESSSARKTRARRRPWRPEEGIWAESVLKFDL